MNRPLSAATAALALVLALAWSPPLQARKITLAEALDLARAHRAEVAEADADVALADLAGLRARMQRLRLTVGTELTEQVQRLHANAPAELCRSLEGLCGAPGHARLFDLTANLEVPLWAGFAIQAGVQRADHLTLAARESKQALLRRLTLEVTSAYWTARQIERQLQVAQRGLQRKAELASILNARTRAGVVPGTDSSRAQSAALRQRAALADLTGRLHQARAQLAAVLQVDEEVEPAEDPGERMLPHPALEQMVAESEQRRPEVRAARAQLQAGDQAVRVARGGLWPQVSLFGRANAQNEILGIPQSRPIASFLAGVIVRWNLFDSLNTYTAIRQAEQERDRSAQAHLRARTQARTEVRVAYRGLEAARLRRTLLEQALAISRDGYELLRRRYEGGSALLIELRDAEEEMEGLEAAVIENDMDIARAATELDTARGEL
jgi:outer membrane protein TolC